VKRNYYCLVAGLQDIFLDTHKLEQTRAMLKEDLKNEFHPNDYKLLELLFLPHDNQNLLNLLFKANKPFDQRGNFTQEEIEENIKEPTTLPEYMVRFIAAHKEKEPVFPEMSPENELATLFYDEILEVKNDFLRNWFGFDMNLRNVVTAFVSRKHNLPYENQIVGSSDISNTIRRSHSRDFGLAQELPHIEDLANIVRIDDIQEREKAIDEMKWKHLDEITFFEYFTAEKVFAFIIKLEIIERWLGIDKATGNELFKKLLGELKATYKLPEIFTK